MEQIVQNFRIFTVMLFFVVIPLQTVFVVGILFSCMSISQSIPLLLLSGGYSN